MLIVAAPAIAARSYDPTRTPSSSVGNFGEHIWGTPVSLDSVALIANVIEAPEGALLLVQDEVALGRGKQPADLAPLS
jgi:hypothetical protein